MELANLRERVLAFLAEQDEPVASSFVGQEIDALDLGYADSGLEDVHVFKELEQLKDEGLVTVQLYGECHCGHEHLFTKGEVERGVVDCPGCGAELAYDHERPLYALRDRFAEKAQLDVRPGRRSRVSPLASRLVSRRLVNA
jgi:predicted Zn-ribbon and HTH transcriptional regulator